MVVWVRDIIMAMRIPGKEKGRYRTLSILLVLSLLAAPAGAAQTAKKKKHFLWGVQAGSTTVYLLGSIHILKKGFYPLSSEIEDAFRSSSVLAVEANIDDVSAADMKEMIGKAMYPAGDSLGKHLPKATYDLVRKELATYGIPPALVAAQRPWFTALTLASLGLLRAGFDPAYGIDRHFLSEAAGRKKIVELEGVGYQVDLLSGLPDKEQEAFLLDTIKDMHNLVRETDRLVSAWRRGDTGTVISLISKGEKERGMSPVYEKILYARNRNMADKVEGLLRSGKTSFVVVGAGHLVGEKGIIHILRQRGYQVRQL